MRLAALCTGGQVCPPLSISVSFLIRHGLKTENQSGPTDLSLVCLTVPGPGLEWGVGDTHRARLGCCRGPVFTAEVSSLQEPAHITGQS